MQINDEQFLLILEYEADSKTHFIDIAETNGSALEAWGSHTRVSPVWRLNIEDKSEPDVTLALGESQYMVFLSCENPVSVFNNLSLSHLKEQGLISAFLTLGSFNLILLLENDVLVPSLTSDGIGHAIEVWELNHDVREDLGRAVTDMSYHCLASAAKPDLSGLQAEIDQTQEHFKPTLIELTALLSMAFARSAIQMPTMSSDMDNLGQTALRFLTDPPALRKGAATSEADKSRILSGLHNINAGLSRLTSQAFSGSIPIAKTECHFWPHSLLGIGTANRALRNTVGFITDVFEDFDFSERVDLLLDVPIESDVRSLEITFRDIVDRFALDEVVPTKNHPTLLPITYFSGRDGFKNSDFTTSAPLMSIQAGNSVTYSLVTISHEVSHRIVSSLIGKVVPQLGRANGNGSDEGPPDMSFPTYREIDEATSRTPANMREMFLDFFCATLIDLSGGERGIRERATDFEDSPEFTEMLVHEHNEDIEEHLVHIFDFWYFFNRDVQNYIRSIWRSWAIIPDISSRVREYTVRTLLALASNNVRTDDWMEKSRDEMLSVFRETSMREALHLTDAVIGILEDPDEFAEIEDEIFARLGVIRIFHMFLKSKSLARELREEQLIAGTSGSRRGREYSFTEEALVQTKFENPIRFLNQYAADEHANAAKSAWLLHMLSGNVASRGPR